ncbi:MAG TPA: hypothetical protein VGA19_05000 [Rhodospirillales bacterium]
MPQAESSRRPDPAFLGRLRRRIRRLERAAAGNPGALALGIAGIDDALPWGGLPRGALNEVLGAADGGGRQGPAFTAAAGFVAALVGRAGGTVLWCRRDRGLYGPGLAALGLDPGRLIVVHGRTDADILWAMEEGLRSGAPAAVVGEAAGPAPVALRRLQLAAEAGGAVALLLRPGTAGETPSPAATRWRIVPAPNAAAGRWPGPPRWRVDLLKCRGGAAGRWPKSWIVEWRGQPGNTTADNDRWHDKTNDQERIKASGFAVVAELPHRPAAPAADGGRGDDRHRTRLAV